MSRTVSAAIALVSTFFFFFEESSETSPLLVRIVGSCMYLLEMLFSLWNDGSSVRSGFVVFDNPMKLRKLWITLPFVTFFLSIKNVDRNRGQNAIRKTNAISNREISCEYSYLIALTPETSFLYKYHKLCNTVFEVYLCRIVT